MLVLYEAIYNKRPSIIIDLLLLSRYKKKKNYIKKQDVRKMNKRFYATNLNLLQ